MVIEYSSSEETDKMIDFQQLYNSETFRQQGHQLIDLLADYFEQISNPNHSAKTFPYLSPEEALSFWQEDFNSPLLENPNDFFKKVIENSIHIHSPRYLGHQVTATLPTAILATTLEATLNNSGAIYEMGMVINCLEKIITNWFSKHLGYSSDSYGIITSGGTIANLTALLTARAMKATDDVWQNGSSRALAVMVSEQAHYCVDRAAKVMGLGEKGVIKVPTDEQFSMRTDLLYSLLAKAKEDNLHVFAIVGSAGTTSTGAYDDLTQIANFAERHNIWFHVDGAHGGVAVLSQKHKYLAQGIDRADSVVADFHKMLLIPSLTTGVFYKNPQDSYQTFAQKASYLFATTDEDWFNAGKRTFECTKPNLVSRIYSVLRTHGEATFSETVDYLYDLGIAFAKMIALNPKFELAHQPKTNIVCFRFLTDDEKDIDRVNWQIRQKIVEKGNFYLVSTILNGRFYLRVALMNPLTTEQELSSLLKEIELIA